jgi:ABC-type hemin transport system substrate-binding protein
MRISSQIFFFLMAAIVCFFVHSAYANPLRVVTLAPNLTELVCAIAPETLAGRASHTTVPESARDIPEVGIYSRPDIERIAALSPDLCLAINDGTPEPVIQRLCGLKIPVHIIKISTLDELSSAVCELGELLHSAEAAHKLEMHLKSEIDIIDSAVSMKRKKPLTLLQVQHSPPMFAGAGTFSDELIARAGGRNLTTQLGYPLMSLEQVLIASPDVIIITRMAQADKAAADWYRFHRLPAVQNSRIHIVPADDFSQPSLRSISALHMLHSLLHPTEPPHEH